MKNNMIIYVSKDGNIKVDVNIQNEDIWMSQDVMANLYDTTKNNISMHLKNIFDEGELEKDSVNVNIILLAQKTVPIILKLSCSCIEISSNSLLSALRTNLSLLTINLLI